MPFRHWDLAGVWGGGDGASPQRPVSVSAEDMAGLGEQEGRGGGPLPRKTAFPSAGRRRAKDRWMPAREMSPPPAARAQAPRAAAFLAAPASCGRLSGDTTPEPNGRDTEEGSE